MKISGKGFQNVSSTAEGNTWMVSSTSTAELCNHRLEKGHKGQGDLEAHSRKTWVSLIATHASTHLQQQSISAPSAPPATVSEGTQAGLAQHSQLESGCGRGADVWHLTMSYKHHPG